jgi:chemotaxis family two-component system response regulator Rcp1
MDILLVEDNPADARLFAEALAEVNPAAHLAVASTGPAALALLPLGLPPTPAHPSLIVLDVNLPGLSGHQVLAALKLDPALRRIPVVMLSTSSAPQDIAAALDRHANAYLLKPPDLDAAVAAVAALDTFWRTALTLPPIS